MKIIWRKSNPLAKGLAKKQVLKISGKKASGVAKKKSDTELKKPKKRSNERRVEEISLFKRERHKRGDYENPELDEIEEDELEDEYESEMEDGDVFDSCEENLRAAQKASRMLSAWDVGSHSEDDDIDDASKAEILAEFLSQLGSQIKASTQVGQPAGQAPAALPGNRPSPLGEIRPKVQPPVNQTGSKAPTPATAVSGAPAKPAPLPPAKAGQGVKPASGLSALKPVGKTGPGSAPAQAKAEPIPEVKPVSQAKSELPKTSPPSPVSPSPQASSAVSPAPATNFSLLNSLGNADLLGDTDEENQIIFADDLLKSIEDREKKAMQLARQRIGNQSSFADFKPETIELLSEKNSGLFAPSVAESCREEYLGKTELIPLGEAAYSRTQCLAELTRLVENKFSLATVASVPTGEGILLALSK